MEGDGFEPSVPRKRSTSLWAAPLPSPQFAFRNENRLLRDRDRWFESISLQQRVGDEPNLRGTLINKAAPTARRRVEMWRGGCRSNISVSAPFVWRCLTGSAVAPFPHPAHRTGHADLPHPALGQDVTPSPTTGRDQAGSGVRARSARRGARVDRLRPCVARLCA